MAINPEQDQRLSELMERSCLGDKAAYNTLLQEVCELLQGYLIRRLGRGPDAEDVLQEVLVSLHGARHTYDKKKPFVPWLFAITRYRICDHWRRSARRLDREDLDGEKIDRAEPETKSQGAMLEDRLEKSLSRLPEKQRRAVDLLKLRGFSIREAAKELEMSESALKVTAHRAYKSLRREFEMESDE